MISVILPSLNVKEYIEDCLNSICQNIDIEIICVDARSDDGTLEILYQYEKNYPNVKVIVSDRKSYGYQMNQGIKAAKGDYIGILETDDYIDVEVFNEFCLYAVKSNVDFVKTGYFEFASGLGRTLQRKNINSKLVNDYGGVYDEKTLDLVRTADPNHFWSGIYRKEFLLKNDIWFNETPGASYQDTSFSVLVNMMASSCIYVDKCFYHYRMDRTESSVKCADKWRCVIDEFEYVDSYFEKHPYNNIEQKYMVDEFRIMSYRWNMLRLDAKARLLFHDAIANEMESILSNTAEMDYFSDEIKSYLKTLIDLEDAAEWIESKRVKKANIDEIIELSKQNGPFICVGAGNWFRDICDIQELIGMTIVREVADNNNDIVGDFVYEYEIKSVSQLIKKYINNKWLITTKHHTEAIRTQLMLEGVDENNIVSIGAFPKWFELCQ